MNPKSLEVKHKAIDFLEKWDGILFNLSELPGAIDGTINLCIEEGGIHLGEINGEVISLSGYTFGEPSKQFSNRNLGYVYLILIDQEFQKKLSKNINAFKDAYNQLLFTFLEYNHKEARFKAYKNNIYNNKLYAKIADPIAIEKNTGGIESVLYSTLIHPSKFIQ